MTAYVSRAQVLQQPEQPPPPQRKPTGTALIAAVIAAFAAYHTAAQITAALRAIFTAAGISVAAIGGIVALVLQWPAPGAEGIGPATNWAVRQNDMRRAAFVLASSRRVQAALAAAKSQGEPEDGTLAQALGLERQWFGQHVTASQGRLTAAGAVDAAASLYGPVLGWHASKDARCTPGCRAAGGRNFLAAKPPIVEGHPAYPGTVHGATCRCRAVAPYRGASLLPSA